MRNVSGHENKLDSCEEIKRANKNRRKISIKIEEFPNELKN